MFHPDLTRNYSFGKSTKNCGYFSYDINEALHLSKDEDTLIEIFAIDIEREFKSSFDTYSSDVIVSNLELILNYCNWFYDRQFVVRKKANNDLLTKFENILAKHFEENAKAGLPTVNSLAEEMNITSGYLSEVLLAATGQNTKQHIHHKLMEKAMETLISTNLKVYQIAFQLGSKYPQSFNKIFKRKANLSPLEFRKSLN